MSDLFKNSKKRLSRMERGQVLMVVAVAIVGIIAVIGIALDVGVMFVENARLRRAVDSAALAAALQYRENYSVDELDRSAIEFLRLNGINDPNAIVQMCIDPAPAPSDPDFIHYDAALCTNPPRKFVKVVASGRANLAFLPVIGINSVPIAAEAISETASVDVVLVIDRSESMTYDANPGTPERDPSQCNVAANPIDGSYQGYCLPFFKVKEAAVKFIDTLYFPYDRVAVVTFDKDAKKIMDFSNVKSDIVTAIKGLTVFEGDETASGPVPVPPGLPGINAIYPNGLPSRYYQPPLFTQYLGLGCPQRDLPSFPNYPDPSPCTTTNIGAGLLYAGDEFNVPPVRTNSLWVVILLTDGVANAGYDTNGIYFCPQTTWGNYDTYDYNQSPPVLISVKPKCNDGISTTRHPGPPSAPGPNYDAEDYAYDEADFVADGQNALIFTIGLGANVITPSTVDGTHLGEVFLTYAANEGKGLYNYAPNGAALAEIFRKIADNIATRLTH